MAIEYLGYGDDDGTVLGRNATTDKIAFFAATPIVRPAATAQSAITAGATTTSTIALVIELRTALVNLGLIKGSI
jgi:hypothetical protein